MTGVIGEPDPNDDRDRADTAPLIDTAPPVEDRLTTSAAASVILLGLITVTGAAVRLTGSGLGCTDWPNCTDDSFAAPWEFHAWIEFGNRLVTGLVAIPVLLTFGLALARRASRPGVLKWATAVGLLTLLNALVGAVTVRTELTPEIVMLHFLLSIATIATAVVCHDRARRGPDLTPIVAPPLQRMAQILPMLALLVLTTGTLVTGTGPHGGDPTATRFDFNLRTVAQLHSFTMWAFGLSALGLALRLVRRRGPQDGTVDPLIRALGRLLLAVCVQGTIGYAQYLWGVPPLLVAAHVLGAVLVWWAALQLPLATSAPFADRRSGNRSGSKSAMMVT